LCRASRQSASSQARIDDRVYVTAKEPGIEGGKASPSTQEYRRAQRRRSIRSEFRHWSPVAGHRQALSGRDPVHNLTTAIAQLPDRYLCHATDCITRETSRPADASGVAVTLRPSKSSF
jgi:hypothetical protein